VFSGDVVLPGGCGRLFRGTAATAMAILNDGLFACLPGAALLFPGHEYTVRAGQSVGLDDREASTHYARASPAPASTPATTLETTSTPAPASGVHHCC
jgi:glyoxylase-like metal-dependent hydrolase (beta-lactamase superfamily II)